MNVLLVMTDERAVRESIRAAMPETDLLIFESTVDTALRRLNSMKIDAILIDDAPALGRTALASVGEAAPSVPVIVLAGRGDAESKAAWLLAGAHTSVAKPFSCDALRDAVRSAVHRGNVRTADAGLHQACAPFSTGEVAKSASISQHQMALRWATRTAANSQDPVHIGQGLIDCAVDVFDAARAVVLLETKGGVRVAASHGVPKDIADALVLSYTGGVMRWFESNTCLLDRRLMPESSAAAKEMQVMGGRLAVPLVTAGRVCGAFVVGEKSSGLEYAADERELLSVIGRCASTSLEKAHDHRSVSSQQNRIDTILAGITAGLVTVMPNKTVTMMNQQAERILNIRAVDVLGRSVQNLGSGFADLILRTLSDGESRLRQEVYDHATKSTLGISVSSLGPDGVVAMFSKLPEQVVKKDEITSSPFWEYLSARVAQEIKNPMVAINTFAQLLPQKYNSEDFREAFFNVVQEEVSRINAVVETLYSFARESEMAVEHSNLNETIQDVLGQFEQKLAEHSIKLETQLDPEATDATLDAQQFSRAVKNVVQNAVEAMPAGGTLWVSTKRRNGSCSVTIADSGPGISKEDASRIFLPFFSTKEKGMGLGLPVAMQIIRQHDGEIKLIEEPDKGSVFTLTVPAA